MIRIVRLELKAENAQLFEAFFAKTKSSIAQMPGCNGVELYKDADQPHVYYTHSYWDSTEDLEHYRQSEFFMKTWTYTKSLFQNKAQAFSLVEIAEE